MENEVLKYGQKVIITEKGFYEGAAGTLVEINEFNDETPAQYGIDIGSRIIYGKKEDFKIV